MEVADQHEGMEGKPADPKDSDHNHQHLHHLSSKKNKKLNFWLEGLIRDDWKAEVLCSNTCTGIKTIRDPYGSEF